MAKRGRPPKAGKRKPCGRLATFVDEGNPSLFERRAELVGERHKHSRFADSVIGRLYLAFAFGHDEELAEQRHKALVDYADSQRRFYGPSTAQSTMRDLGEPRGRSLGGDDEAGYARFKAWHTALLELKPAPGCRLLTSQVVERAAVYEVPPANAAELATLISAADRLIELRGGVQRRRPRHRLPPGRPRHRDILAFYSREVFGPSDEQLAEALAKFRLLPPAGEAD